MIDLVPVWNGTMQRARTTELHLSAYVGGSSLHQSANWERFDQAYDKPVRRRAIVRGSKDAEVRPLIQQGLGLNQICAIAGVSNTVVLRCKRALIAAGQLKNWTVKA